MVDRFTLSSLSLLPFTCCPQLALLPSRLLLVYRETMSDDPLASLSPAQRDSFETFNAFTARDSKTPEEARKSVEMLRDAGWDVQVRLVTRQRCSGCPARSRTSRDWTAMRWGG